MSTGAKRPIAEALADAEAFKALFPPTCYQRWVVAGSIRRQKPEVGDVEHAVLPAFGPINVGGGLFAETKEGNLLWHHLNQLVANGTLAKHVYGATGYRWGERYRGMDFRGFLHEIWTATETNFGNILFIRTGPAEYSQAIVTQIRNGGRYVQDKGFLVEVATGNRIPCPDEATYCRYAGIPLLSPTERR